MLDVADPALVIGFGPNAMQRPCYQLHVPKPSKRAQAVVEFHLPYHRVMVPDQGRGVVQQQLARQPAEAAERTLQPRRLPLMGESLGTSPPRVAERRHEQVRPDPLAAFRHDPAPTEVDLQLTARQRLEPHHRQELANDAGVAASLPDDFWMAGSRSCPDRHHKSKRLSTWVGEIKMII